MDKRISFSSDYTRGAHPRILERLSETNFEQVDGYGTDEYCKSAADKIKTICGCPDGDVFFLVGGTQTNQTIIDMLLKPYEGVVAAGTGHIAAHEAGAIEFSGHKVLTIGNYGQEKDTLRYGDNIGKISAAELDRFIALFYEDISHPTEYGTLYTKKELTDISSICRKYGVPLFLDGARLGYGLMSRRSDVTIKDIADLVDVFYIGGTKVGALFGEAVVFPRGMRIAHPVPVIKQHGALLAKGWLLGLQFDTLFTDDLYFTISKNAIEMAELLRKGLKDKGYELFIDSPTNQQFIVVSDEKLKELDKKIRYGFWEKKDEGQYQLDQC